MKKALVLGLGISGKSARAFLEKRGFSVTGIDDAGESSPCDLHAFDLFVPSPGIPQNHPLYVQAKEKGIPIKGEAELALSAFQGRVIGVTGTNGKTTLVRMLEHIFPNVRAAGNVGIPLTQVVDEKREAILAVELSSFQLETMQAPSLDLGFVLNIEEDHLDRYADGQAYACAKGQISHCIRPGGALYVERKTLVRFPSLFPGAIPFSGTALDAVDLASQKLGLTPSCSIESFSKPAHRLEFVSRQGGVDFYNDSKATNVSAVLFGIDQIKGPIVLILGGLDKGLSFSPLVKKKERLQSVIAYGAARKKIAAELEGEVSLMQVTTLGEAVKLAEQLAREGDTVLFSPGCASFDSFGNYAERGEAFKQLVLQRSEVV